MNKKTVLLIVVLVLCAGALAFLGVRLGQESASRQETAALLDESRSLNTQLQSEKDSLSASLASETEAKDAALKEKTDLMASLEAAQAALADAAKEKEAALAKNDELAKALTAAETARPVKARYAWTDWSDRVNLFGENGLPLEPFDLQAAR